ncbi:zinc ribbon-containing protein [Gallaecimonas sp. GXIMD1310]|uniref:zinc ribbon-containing protein n=1 Tax=Gallaecimonas sp. GXIMD1310 TaxID=3131926 RepID=UPI003250917F
MPLKSYQALIDELKKRLKEGDVEAHFTALVEEAKALLHAAGELSKDEWALIEAKLRDDLHALADHDGELGVDPRIEELWKLLYDAADHTQLDWQSFARDLAHPEGYRTNDVIGFGALRCRRCGFVMHFYHPGSIPLCPQCGNDHFQREPSNTTQ